MSQPESMSVEEIVQAVCTTVCKQQSELLHQNNWMNWGRADTTLDPKEAIAAINRLIVDEFWIAILGHDNTEEERQFAIGAGFLKPHQIDRLAELGQAAR